MNIGVVSRTDREEAVELARDVVRILEGHDVLVDADLVPLIGGTPIGEQQLDFLVTIGGDGTILRAAAQYGDIPLITVNMGTYGFMCELTPDEATSIPSLIDSHAIDTRNKLQVVLRGKKLGTALNEIVIRSSSPIKMDHLSVAVGDESHDIYGDGIIVATPTGSTAYSLSAGGPIIHTRAPVVCITPICPLFGEAHPYVVPDSCEVALTNLGKESVIIMDGQPTEQMKTGDFAIISRSDEQVRFVRRNQHEACP
jgi:NAD+ kinase